MDKAKGKFPDFSIATMKRIGDKPLRDYGIIGNIQSIVRNAILTRMRIVGCVFFLIRVFFFYLIFHFTFMEIDRGFVMYQ